MLENDYDLFLESEMLTEFRWGSVLYDEVVDLITFASLRAFLSSVSSSSEIPMLKLEARKFIDRVRYISSKKEQELFLKECEMIKSSIRQIPQDLPDREERIKICLGAIKVAQELAKNLKFKD
jgi:hypothetical protein